MHDAAEMQEIAALRKQASPGPSPLCFLRAEPSCAPTFSPPSTQAADLRARHRRLQAQLDAAKALEAKLGVQLAQARAAGDEE